MDVRCVLVSLQVVKIVGKVKGMSFFFFFFSSRRRHTRLQGDWSSDVCSSDLPGKGYRMTSRGPGIYAPVRTSEIGSFSKDVTPPPDRKSVV